MNVSSKSICEYKGLKIVQQICISKVVNDGYWFEKTERKKIKSILNDYLSTSISYNHAVIAAGNNHAMHEVLLYAHQIIDAIKSSIRQATSKWKSQSPRRWTESEDLRLIGGVLIYGVDNFRDISKFVGNGRNRAQCIQRWSRTLNPHIKKNGWTTEEDIRLLDIVKKCNPLSWTHVAKMIGERTDVQCRYRYQQLMKKPFKEIKDKCTCLLPGVNELSDLFRPYSVDEFLRCFS